MPTFAAPTALNGSNPSGLNVNLTWTAPPSVGTPLLLYHMDGNMTDASPSGINGTVGSACSFTSSPAEFTQSLSLPSVGAFGPTKLAYATIAAAGPIDLSTLPAWTIEGFLYLNATNSGQNLLWMGAGSALTNGMALDCDGSGNVTLSILGANGSSPGSKATKAITAGSFHHVAMTKRLDPLGSGYDVYQIYVDGVGGTPTPTSPGYAGPYNAWTGYLSLNGYFYVPTSQFLGGQSQGIYWDEIRISGSCLYTANFTPPAAPFPNIGSTPDGYDIYRNGPSIAITTGGPGFNDVVPVSGTYTYTVAAQNGGVDSSPQSAPFTITIGSTLGTTPNFLDDEQIGGAYVNSKLTLVEFTYLPSREPFLEGATNLIINRYKQEPTDVRQRGVDYTYFVVSGEVIQSVAVTGISAQGVPQASTNPLVTPLVVTDVIVDPQTQLKFAYTVSGGQDGVEYTIQFTTITQVQTSTVEEIFSINVLVEDSFP
jgi:Concanavalin A-like lectin/glucanases superfamily